MKRIMIMFLFAVCLCTASANTSPTSNSPTAVFLAFHQSIRDGDVASSWELLSSTTQAGIVQEAGKLSTDLKQLKTLTTDPRFINAIDEMKASMHLDKIAEDRDWWGAMLAEAKENGDRVVYLSPKLKVTGERITDGRAEVDIACNNSKGIASLVWEDGQWKVEQPYVISLARSGWTVDLAAGVSNLGMLVTKKMEDSTPTPRKPVTSIGYRMNNNKEF